MGSSGSQGISGGSKRNQGISGAFKAAQKGLKGVQRGLNDVIEDLKEFLGFHGA